MQTASSFFFPGVTSPGLHSLASKVNLLPTHACSSAPLQLNAIKLPPGFRIAIYAAKVPGARSLGLRGRGPALRSCAWTRTAVTWRSLPAACAGKNSFRRPGESGLVRSSYGFGGRLRNWMEQVSMAFFASVRSGLKTSSADQKLIASCI